MRPTPNDLTALYEDTVRLHAAMRFPEARRNADELLRALGPVLRAEVARIARSPRCSKAPRTRTRSPR